MKRLILAAALALCSGAPAALAQTPSSETSPSQTSTAVGTAVARTHDETPSTLRIDIVDIKPIAPKMDSTLIVSGTVTNTGATPVYGGLVSLNDSDQAVSRADLDAFEAAPTPFGRTLISKALPSTLAAGRSMTFRLEVPEFGQFVPPTEDERVFRVAVVATSAVTKGGATTPLGLVAVPVPYFDAHISGALRLALIIPITAPPDQGPAPVEGSAPMPPSTELIDALAPDGRLGRLLTVIEAAPAGGGTGGTQLTVAIDPALLNRVCALAGRCGINMIAGTPAPDSDVANAWLKRLFVDVGLPSVTVVGLPNADADLSALTAAGDTAAVVDLLEQNEVKRKIPSISTTDVQPLLPVDGLADTALTSAAIRAGSTVAVVSSTQFEPVVPVSGGPVTPSASTLLSTPSGTLPALVTDGALEALLTPPATDQSLPRLQEQRLLADLAVITSELPNQLTPRTVVLEAPRDWDVPLAFSTNLVNALGAVPYVSSEGLQTLEGAPPVARVRLPDPPAPATSPLPAAAIAQVDAARLTVKALKSVAVDPATETLSDPFSDGLDRSLSAWWRADPKTGAALLASVTNDLTTTMGKISVAGGRHGVLLTGPSGILPVQVSNRLNEPIRIVVHVKTDGLDQVSGRDVSQTFQPSNSSYQVSVPITTRSTRSVSVTMQLLAQTGGAEVAAATIQVRSTSVGKVAVGITAAALTLLILLIVVRGVRRYAAHRRANPATPAGT